MGLLDILGGGGTSRSGMSPLMLGLMGVLAYRTLSATAPSREQADAQGSHSYARGSRKADIAPQ